MEVQNQTDYIPKDIQDLSQLGYIKKERAKKAIRSLLSVAPHTIEEIADHFEISPELVKGLIMELTKAKLVVNVPNHSSKYYSKSKQFDGKVKNYDFQAYRGTRNDPENGAGFRRK